MSDNNLSRLKILLVIISALVTCVSLGVMAAAFFTQSWQVVYAPEIEQYYMRGLFEECAFGSRFGRGTDVLCTFTMYDPATNIGGWTSGWANPYYGNPGDRFAGAGSFKFEPYRLTTLCLLSLSMFFGLVGLIFTFCALRLLCPAVAAAACIFLAELCAAAGVICFWRNALDPINTVVLIVTRPALQSIGYSFYVGVGATLCFLLAMFLTFAMAGIVYAESQQNQQSPPHRMVSSYPILTRPPEVLTGQTHTRPPQVVTGHTYIAHYPYDTKV